MKHTIEFYDKHGLLLHSDPHYQTKEIPNNEDTPHRRVVEATSETLEEMGTDYPRAKIITVRTVYSDQLFPDATDVINPHWKEEKT